MQALTERYLEAYASKHCVPATVEAVKAHRLSCLIALAEQAIRDGTVKQYNQHTRAPVLRTARPL